MVVEMQTLWTRAEVAARLGVAVRTVDRLRTRGLLSAVRVFRSVRFRPADVLTLVTPRASNPVREPRAGLL